MTAEYICPHCKGHLLLNDYLIFSVKGEDGVRMLLLLSPEIGNYKSVYHRSHVVRDGMRFEFFCPVCGAGLYSNMNRNLAMIWMKDPDNKLYELHFSRIAGQKSTFQVMGKEVKTFGEDAPQYLDFINLIDMS